MQYFFFQYTAKIECASGWTKQYSGYLMADYFNHPSPSEYICVDEAFDGRVGSEDNHNGRLLYYTMSRCGSLPCPPYQELKPVSCVVCSK